MSMTDEQVIRAKALAALPWWDRQTWNHPCYWEIDKGDRHIYHYGVPDLTSPEVGGVLLETLWETQPEATVRRWEPGPKGTGWCVEVYPDDWSDDEVVYMGSTLADAVAGALLALRPGPEEAS